MGKTDIICYNIQMFLRDYGGKMMKKRIKVLCLLLVALAVLAGCAASSKKGTLKVGVRDDIMGFGQVEFVAKEVKEESADKN